MNANQGSIDTVVVGAGQAGLCMSHHLSQRNVPHVILERARVGERWRTERWESLRFQFPNAYVRFPGFDYDGDDAAGFMRGDEVVRVLERYAKHISAPVRSGVHVRSVERSADGAFTIASDDFELRARNVVLATGPYQRPVVPNISTQFVPDILQLTASSYIRADVLPQGAVLVVGSGASGVQIADDLLENGRSVYLSVGSHRRIPRRHRGRDITDWFEELGLLGAPLTTRPEIDHSPLITGVNGGYDVDLRDLAERGGYLLGRLEGVEGNTLLLGATLLSDISKGDDSFDQTLAVVDARIAELGIDAPEPPRPIQPRRSLPPESPASVDLEAAGISSIIWATGYRLDFSWLTCCELDDDGGPVHQRGITNVPGLYCLGLPNLHSARSTVLWGVGDDAEFLAEHLVARSAD